jgi:hypothetical protein
VSATTLDSRELDLAAAKELLARLERYAATHRPAPRLVPAAGPALAAPALAPASVDVAAPRRWVRPTSVDLFPYDLVGVIAGCAATITAYISLGRPVALAVTAGLAVAGESARRLRWLPSLGVNLLVGTLAGVILVFTA